LRRQALPPILTKGKDAERALSLLPLPTAVAMKTQMSRFQIHDDLTAPEASLPVVKCALAGAGQLPNFLGVLAGSPAALRAYARFRSELRNNGTLTLKTLERIALAVAQQYGSQAGLTLHGRTGRQAGLGLDELSLAREWESRDNREAALLRYLRPLAEQRQCPSHLLEEAREAGWTDEQLLEAVAVVALEGFTAMVHIAGDVPADGSVEDARVLRAA
jgi:alkylhydroperoxidase family enzyme